MAEFPLAERLLAAGIPVIVVGPHDRPRQSGWQNLAAGDCDLSLYRPGDALAVVGGHGIDLVDVDSKNGGSVDNLPPFKPFGMTRTPSGGAHYVVPSSGLGKISPLTTDLGHVGDYVGGRADGSGRLLGFLPGSARSKYPDGGYVEEVPWDVDACLAADPDPDLVDALLRSGGAREARADAYVDGSPVRPAAAGVHPYAAAAVARELARLDECEVLGWDGPGWDDTTFKVACNLIEFANSNWSGYSLEQAAWDFYSHAPSDDGFGRTKHEAKWASALNRVSDGGRRSPDSTPQDDFDRVAGEAAPQDGGGIPAAFRPVSLSSLLDPDRPPRQYVVEPFIAVGTSVAFVAPAGHRKSLLGLGLALAVARGDDAFAGMPIPQARRVLYIDTENTEDDLAERLLSFGVTHDEDLSRFNLVSLPPMDPLDTAKGGAAFLSAVDAYGLEPGDLVVLDSYQRITEAGENDSDTTRAYYRHTGQGLKERGLTVVRMDNTGKDVKKGARGSSGKRDDVDVEYLIESKDDHIEVAVGKARQRGVTQMTILVEQRDGRTTFKAMGSGPTTMTDVDVCVEWLDEKGVDPALGHSKVESLVPYRAGTQRRIFSRPTIRRAVAVRRERAGDFAEALPDE